MEVQTWSPQEKYALEMIDASNKALFGHNQLSNCRLQLKRDETTSSEELISLFPGFLADLFFSDDIRGFPCQAPLFSSS